MEKRRLGRTGHTSTVAIFGSYALYSATQVEADTLMEKLIGAGVNHIDTSPFYGLAEERLGPWMVRERSRFFLGCKTMLRARSEAADQLRRSLERLHTDRLDLYQLHEVTSMEELDKCTRPGGSLEAIVQAREEGLTRFIGICSHSLQAPAVILEALRRFDFDTVLFPINFVLYADPVYKRTAEEVLRQCRARDVGVMIIKSVAKGPWGDQPKVYQTWYRPFDDAEHIRQGVNFVLSQDVTGLCTSGEPSILPLILDSCERFSPLNTQQQEALIATADQYEPIFV